MQYYDTPRSVKEALELAESSSGTGDNSNIFYLKQSSLLSVALFYIVGLGPFDRFEMAAMPFLCNVICFVDVNLPTVLLMISINWLIVLSLI